MTTTRERTIRAGSPSGSGWRPLVDAAGVGDAPPGVAGAAATSDTIVSLRLPIDGVYPLGQALARLERREVCGKVVVRLDDPSA